MASEDDTTNMPEDSRIDTESPTIPQTSGGDEVYCTSCGEIIKEDAKMCPECGVEQPTDDTSPQTNTDSDYEIPDAKQYELEKIANKDVTTVMAVSFLLTPLGYYMVGKTGLAVINLLTFNYLLLGWIIVPFHTRKIIKEARTELHRAGVEGY